MDELIRLLENWQVAQQLSGAARTPARPVETRRDRRGTEPPRRVAPPRPQTHPPEAREEWHCFRPDRPPRSPVSGEQGRVYALGLRWRRPRAHWAHQEAGGPYIPARVGDQNTQALNDTGSVVTLLRPDLAIGRLGEPNEVACIHGDTRTYAMCQVVVRTPRGAFTVRAGIVPNLPVPLLIGRDCPIFNRLWERRTRFQTARPQQGRCGRPVRHAYGARAPHSSPTEKSGHTPACPTGGAPRPDRSGTP